MLTVKCKCGEEVTFAIELALMTKFCPGCGAVVEVRNGVANITERRSAFPKKGGAKAGEPSFSQPAPEPRRESRPAEPRRQKPRSDSPETRGEEAAQFPSGGDEEIIEIPISAVEPAPQGPTAQPGYAPLKPKPGLVQPRPAPAPYTKPVTRLPDYGPYGQPPPQTYWAGRQKGPTPGPGCAIIAIFLGVIFAIIIIAYRTMAIQRNNAAEIATGTAETASLNYASKVEIKNFKVERSSQTTDTALISLKVRNNGEETITALTVKVMFLDRDGKLISSVLIKVLEDGEVIIPGWERSIVNRNVNTPPDWSGQCRWEVGTVSRRRI